MTDYPEPRRVVLTFADLRQLTVLERARACALAGIAERDIGPLLKAVSTHDGSPEMIERAVLALYAMAYQLERRRDPAVTWEQAQSWALALDLESSKADPIAEAEAKASVDAAIGTGLPPSIAGELTLAQVDAYATHRREVEKASSRTRRRARVHR